MLCLTLLTQCISLPRLDTAEHGYDDWDVTDDTTGKVWNPARLPGYQYRYKEGQIETDQNDSKHTEPEVVLSTLSDHDKRYTWDENTNTDDMMQECEADSMIQNILLNHTFDS